MSIVGNKSELERQLAKASLIGPQPFLWIPKSSEFTEKLVKLYHIGIGWRCSTERNHSCTSTQLRQQKRIQI